MIAEDKDRVIVTIPKEQKKQLEKYCKDNNINKSAAVAIALSTLFYAGYKAGDAIGQMIIDKTTYKKEDKAKND